MANRRYTHSADSDSSGDDHTSPSYLKMSSIRHSTVENTTKLLDHAEAAWNCACCGLSFRAAVYRVHGAGLVCQNCLRKNRWQGQRLQIYDPFLGKFLVLPCWNAKTGCEKVALTIEELNCHLERCEYGHANCIAPRCNWLGQPDDLVGHFEENHRKDVIGEETGFTVDFDRRAFVVAKLLIRNTFKCFWFIQRELGSDRIECYAFRVEKGRTQKVAVEHRCEMNDYNSTRRLNMDLDMIDWRRVANRIHLVVFKEEPDGDCQLSVIVRLVKNKAQEEVTMTGP